MREIIYVLLPQFADHEIPFLSEGITNGEMGPRQEHAYCNKIAVTFECFLIIPSTLCLTIMPPLC